VALAHWGLLRHGKKMTKYFDEVNVRVFLIRVIIPSAAASALLRGNHTEV
jgi:hypothetical protein